MSQCRTTMPKIVEEHNHGQKLKDVYLAMYKKKMICGIGVDYAKIPNMAMMYVYQNGGGPLPAGQVFPVGQTMKTPSSRRQVITTNQ